VTSDAWTVRYATAASSPWRVSAVFHIRADDGCITAANGAGPAIGRGETSNRRRTGAKHGEHCYHRRRFQRWHACAPLDRAKTESSRSTVERSSSRSRNCCKPWLAARTAEMPRNNRAEVDVADLRTDRTWRHASVGNQLRPIHGVGHALESASHNAVEMRVSDRQRRDLPVSCDRHRHSHGPVMRSFNQVLL
jgi:hypothetical protein